jgi:hypothetical protein
MYVSTASTAYAQAAAARSQVSVTVKSETVRNETAICWIFALLVLTLCSQRYLFMYKYIVLVVRYDIALLALRHHCSLLCMQDTAYSARS